MHTDSESDDDTHCTDPVSDESVDVYFRWADRTTNETVPPPSRATLLSMLSMGYQGPVMRRVTQPARGLGHDHPPFAEDSDDRPPPPPPQMARVRVLLPGEEDPDLPHRCANCVSAADIERRFGTRSVAVQRLEDGVVRVMHGSMEEAD